jgi:hypothetical protein
MGSCMADQSATPRISCLALAVTAALAAGAVLVARGWAVNSDPLRWPATAGAALVAVAVFWTERRLQGFLWGVVAALLITLHHGLREPDSDGWGRFFAEAIVVTVMAGLTVCWEIAFLPRNAWQFWPFVALLLAAGIGLAWACEPRAGALALVLTALSLATASVLSWVLRGRKSPQGPAFLNMVAAALMAVLVPALGLFIFRLIDQPSDSQSSFWAPLLQARNAPLRRPGSVSIAELNRCFWPLAWLTGPIMLWGLWRATRNGWRQWQRTERPLAWILLLFALALVPAVFFWPLREADKTPLTLSVLVVLLTTYLAVDLLRSGARRLVLPPPYEREMERVGGQRT